MVVAKDLDFDVAGVFDQSFDIDTAIAERASGLAGRTFKQGSQVLLAVDPAHSFSAATGYGLEHDRETGGSREFEGFIGRGEALLGTRDDGGSTILGNLAGTGLGAHQTDGAGRRADEDDSGILASLGEIGIFAEEAVARMDGLGPVALGGGDDFVDTEVALGRRRGTQVRSLIGLADMQRRAVGIGIHRDRGDPHFAQGTDHTEGDFTPVGN